VSRLPTIPDFNESLVSITTALRTLKLGMEILGGLRPGSESQGAPLVFVQGQQPRIAMDNARRKGDLWIDTDNDTLSYWDGGGWHGVTGLNVIRTYVSATEPPTPIRHGDQWMSPTTGTVKWWNNDLTPPAWVALP